MKRLLVKEGHHRLKLLIQILCFLNLYCFIFWCISIGFFYYYQQFESLSIIHNTLLTISIIIAPPADAIRLYFGYSGNLTNNVLDSAGFLMLSLLILLPIHTYLLISFHQLFIHVQLYLQIFIITLLVIEVAVEFLIIKKSLKERALMFQMEHSHKNK